MPSLRKSPRRRPPAPTRAAWARIRLFAMDVDGVLTDGTVQVSSDGTESKGFSVLDGLGLARLRKAGVMAIVVTGGEVRPKDPIEVILPPPPHRPPAAPSSAHP